VRCINSKGPLMNSTLSLWVQKKSTFTVFLIANFIFTSSFSTLAFASTPVRCASAVGSPSVEKVEVVAGSSKAQVVENKVERRIGLIADPLLENAEPGPQLQEALRSLFRMAGSNSNFTSELREPRKKGEFKLSVFVSKADTLELKYEEENRYGQAFYLLTKVTLKYPNKVEVVLMENALDRDLNFAQRELVWSEVAESVSSYVSSITIPRYIRGTLLKKYLNWTDRFEALSASELRSQRDVKDRAVMWTRYGGNYLKELFTKRSEKEIVRWIFTLGLTALAGYLLGVEFGIFGGKSRSSQEEIDWDVVDNHKQHLNDLLISVSPKWQLQAPFVYDAMAKLSKAHPAVSINIVVGYGESQKLVAFYAQKEGEGSNGVVRHYASPLALPINADQGRAITEFSRTGILIVSDLLFSSDGVKSSMSIVVRRAREPILYEAITAALLAERAEYDVQSVKPPKVSAPPAQ
jgi:hypothetical protein